MKELFLTATRPRHRYKSEKFFVQFLRLRAQSVFGRLDGKQESTIKKMQTMKKFLLWFYQFPNVRTFRKLFATRYRNQNRTLRSCLGFFCFLEQQIPVILVRSGFAATQPDATNLVRSGSVFVNGSTMLSPHRTLSYGDILEVQPNTSAATIIMGRRAPLFFSRELQRYRLNYVFPSGVFHLIQGPSSYQTIKLPQKLTLSIL